MAVAKRSKLATSRRRRGRPASEVASRLPILLLDAAQELFLGQGYGATTVEQVASQIGATKRTVYAKFGDKAGLFAAMARRLVESRRGWLASVPIGETIDARLISFGTHLLSLVLAPEMLALHRVLTAESQRFPELAALVNQLSAQGARRRLARVIRDEVDRGTLTVTTPEVAAELLVGMIINAAMLASMLGREPVPGTRGSSWVEAAVSIFLDGCRNRSGMVRPIVDPGSRPDTPCQTLPSAKKSRSEKKQGRSVARE